MKENQQQGNQRVNNNKVVTNEYDVEIKQIEANKEIEIAKINAEKELKIKDIEKICSELQKSIDKNMAEIVERRKSRELELRSKEKITKMIVDGAKFTVAVASFATLLGYSTKFSNGNNNIDF